MVYGSVSKWIASDVSVVIPIAIASARDGFTGCDSVDGSSLCVADIRARCDAVRCEVYTCGRETLNRVPQTTHTVRSLKKTPT
eukprot:gene9683-biopygen15266